MSKLDLLQYVMIFPFGIMNLKVRDRKYAAFDQIALTSTMKSEAVNGKALEGLQARSDPVYEPMSVSLIFRLGQKEPRWTPQQESSGIRFYRSFNVLVSNFKKNFALCTFTKSGFQHRWLQPSESLCPHILLHLPPSMFRCQNHTISHEGLVSSPQLPYNK